MVGWNVIHYVCTLVVLLVQVHAGSSQDGREQTRQASRDVIMREDAEEVFYTNRLKENSGRSNGNQAVPKTEISETLTEIGTGHIEERVVHSPPSFHPRNQPVKPHRNQHRAVETVVPDTNTSKVPTACSQKPDDRACGVALKRYYFDRATMECYKFIYGGCQGSGNNFQTLESCNMACLGHE